MHIGVFPVDVTKNRSQYSIESSCAHLSDVGLDTFLGDLLYLTYESNGTDEILASLKFPNIASQIRAKSQLMFMLPKFKKFVNEKRILPSNFKNGNYLSNNSLICDFV